MKYRRPLAWWCSSDPTVVVNLQSSMDSFPGQDMFRQIVGEKRIIIKKMKKSLMTKAEMSQVTLHNETANVGANSLYVRTAYRNEADFSVRDLRRPSAPSDEIQRRRLIDDDKSVSGNYQRLIFETASGVYDELNDEMTVRTLREELVGKIQESMRNVFDDLVLQNISDPFGSDSHSGSFYFQKGEVNFFPYKNLSAGEKIVFDLMLDIHLKKKYFVDAIYCIDEVESHLHTQAQGKTLRELVAILPSDSQLWVTTHSLGILRAAEELEHDSPGAVCILDFGEIEPDVATTLTPATLGKVAWDKLLSITLDDLSARVAPSVIVVCEGTYSGTRRYNFDAGIYNRIMGAVEHGIVFISGGSSEHIEGTGLTVIQLLSTTLPTTKVVALRDRDDMSDDQVAEWTERGNLCFCLNAISRRSCLLMMYSQLLSKNTLHQRMT